MLGIAPAAHLLALKACWPIHPGAAQAVCDTFTLALALDAAITLHANVVNLSLAGPPDPLLSRLIRYGMRRGIVYVGAVAPSRLGLRQAFPTDIPGVLAVQSGEDAVGTSRHLSAPGRGILTLVPGGSYDFASGSSMATAEVAGVVALLLAEKRGFSASELDTILARSSRRIATPEGPMTSIDACSALAQLLGSAPCASGGTVAEAVPAAAPPR
jgi:subtilisin family serine protease